MKKLLLFIMATIITSSAQSSPDAAELSRMAARFAPTPLAVDISALSPGDKGALVKLIGASKVVNRLFMQQLWSGNLPLYKKLQQDKTPLGRARLHYFWINKGPWSEIDGHTAFLPGVPAHKPPGANFYPEDMTKEEFETWTKSLLPSEKTQAEGFFTVIRRDADKDLTIVPYSDEYEADLDRAADLLRQAAELTDNASLNTFLNTRVDAFSTNDYFHS